MRGVAAAPSSADAALSRRFAGALALAWAAGLAAPVLGAAVLGAALARAGAFGLAAVALAAVVLAALGLAAVVLAALALPAVVLAAEVFAALALAVALFGAGFLAAVLLVVGFLAAALVAVAAFVFGASAAFGRAAARRVGLSSAGMGLRAMAASSVDASGAKRCRPYRGGGSSVFPC